MLIPTHLLGTSSLEQPRTPLHIHPLFSGDKFLLTLTMIPCNPYPVLHQAAAAASGDALERIKEKSKQVIVDLKTKYASLTLPVPAVNVLCWCSGTRDV